MYAKLIKEKKTPWGARILAARFPAHGSVSFTGSILGGARAADSEEFAKIHALMLLEGTKKRGKREIQTMLDSWGASLSFFITNDRLAFSGRVRVRNLDQLLKLLVEILTESNFPAKELDVVKKRELGNLALEAQDTRAQAQIELSHLLYQPGHPNWVETTEDARADLGKITPRALREHHAKILGRNSLIFSAVGDIAPQDLFTLIEKRFKKLPDNSLMLPKFVPAKPGEARKAAKKIAHKASIDYMLGVATGITSEHAEYVSLLLGLTVLGYRGGFNGRLMKIVREAEGLTYGIYALTSGFRRATDGHAYVWATFAPELFQRGRASTMREVRRIVEKGVTAQEAAQYGSMFDASWRVNLSNSYALARAAHETAAEGRDMSYLDTFPKKILKVTAQEVNRALKKYLMPEKLSEAAAGPVEKTMLA